MAQGPMSSILVTIRIIVWIQESEVRNPDSLDYRITNGFWWNFMESLGVITTDYILVTIWRSRCGMTNPLIKLRYPSRRQISSLANSTYICCFSVTVTVNSLSSPTETLLFRKSHINDHWLHGAPRFFLSQYCLCVLNGNFEDWFSCDCIVPSLSPPSP